jgi:type IV pilus assembly protein PilA
VSFFSKQTVIKIEYKTEEKNMRNKIKQLLKKEGGFTLIELLAVIAILGFIIAISVPLVGNVIAKSEATTNKAKLELVIDAAKLYDINDGSDTDATVTSTDLVTAGYLDSDTNPVITVTRVEGTNGTVKYTAK